MIRRLQDFLFPHHYFKARVSHLHPVPAYFFHTAEAQEFELLFSKISYLSITSITFNQLLNGIQIKEPAVLLTFDDGWSSIWSVVFPLARRHGIRFTLFIVPQLIENSEECRKTLDDGVTPSSLVARDQELSPMLTWGEIKAMHDSGIVDVQSHSLSHGVINKSDKLVGFCSPQSQFPIYGMAPLLSRINGQDVAELTPPLGIPLYPFSKALCSEQRFIENEKVRETCISIVKEGGGTKFFRKKGWEADLKSIIEDHETGVWEDEKDRRERFFFELSSAKRIIEERLPGSNVRVLAPPWGTMHADIPAIAKEIGHELIVLCYPFSQFGDHNLLPLYPRLKGDMIWPLLEGPLRGGIKWWHTRRRLRARQATGAIP